MKLRITAKLLFLVLIYAICVGGKMSYVSVESQGSGATRKDAIKDALQMAVSQVNGAEVAAQMQSSFKESFSEKDGEEKFSVSENLQEAVQIETKGVVRSWDVLSEDKETGDDGLWIVRLKVSVAQYKLSKQLERLRITVAPFQISQAVSDGQLATQFLESFPNGLVGYLAQTRRFALLDRDFLENQSQELAFIKRGDVRAEELAKLGNKVGADYIVVGIVEDVFSHESKVTMRSTGQQITNVQTGARVSYRIIDVATTQITFSDTVAYDPGLGKATVGEMVDYISNIAGQTIVNAIYPVSVVSNAGSQVTLGQGGKTIRMGEQFHLVRYGKAIVDPHTKESLGREEIVVGVLKITNVQSKTSTAEIIEGGQGLSKSFASNKYIARPFPKEAAPDPGQKVREAVKSSREEIDKRLEDDF
jgi:curli biogenesis system outer membrane secretion channel CsgG